MITKNATSIIRELDPFGELSFLRLRSKQFEVLVSPDGENQLIVIQDHLKLTE